jgi:hypothetical protein
MSHLELKQCYITIYPITNRYTATSNFFKILYDTVRYGRPNFLWQLANALLWAASRATREKKKVVHLTTKIIVQFL